MPMTTPKTSFAKKRMSEIYYLVCSASGVQDSESRLGLYDFYGMLIIIIKRHQLNYIENYHKGQTGDGYFYKGQTMSSDLNFRFPLFVYLNPTNQMRSILLLLLAMSLLHCKIIQVPPLTNDGSLSLRLDQKATIDAVYSSFGNLTRIYKKQVKEIIDGQETDFPTCQQQPPWANFWGTSYLGIVNEVNHYGLVYKFQQVKYPRSLIDIAYYENKAYYVLENGEIHVVKIGGNYKSIKEAGTYQSSESNVNKGNFVLLANSGYGVFINHNQAVVFNLNDDTFTAVPQFQKRKDFETAIPLQGNYFAAAFGDEGMVIFSVDFKDNTLKVIAELNNDNSGSSSALNIKDLAYDSNRKLLFIVDYNSVILSMQLTFGKDTLSTRVTSSTIPKKQCNLIYYDPFNDQLYLNCKTLQKYRINNWPIIDQKVLPRQDISIREITSSGPVVALVGRDIFQIISADRKAAIYQDKLMDKLILNDGHFISGNQNGILIGGYEVYPPSITCSAIQKSLLGTHKLLIKVTAQCNQKYFNSIGFQPGAFTNDDKCVYSLYRNMVVWQPAAINTTPFMIIGIMLGVLGLAIFIWWAFSYLNFRRLKNYFDNNYSNLEEEAHHQTANDKQKDDSNPSIQSNPSSGTNQKMAVAKPAQMQMQSEELHDIQ